jgi:5-methylcytosine-specific restriction endonuclease McrA
MRYCLVHGIVPADHRCGRWANGSSRAWRRQRARILARDNHTCWCGATATEVHHLKPGRARVVPDSELRSVCFTHNPRGG